MLAKLQKTLHVVEELRKIPRDEREWLLSECKYLVDSYREIYETEFNIAATGTRRLAVVKRLRTLEIAQNLLNTIRLQ